jgi:hypothetical protein
LLLPWNLHCTPSKSNSMSGTIFRRKPQLATTQTGVSSLRMILSCHLTKPLHRLLGNLSSWSIHPRANQLCLWSHSHPTCLFFSVFFTRKWYHEIHICPWFKRSPVPRIRGSFSAEYYPNRFWQKITWEKKKKEREREKGTWTTQETRQQLQNCLRF